MQKKIFVGNGAFEAHGVTAFAKKVTLKPYEEVVGHLHQLEQRDEMLLAEIGDIVVRLPLAMRPALAHLLGSRVGIIRTDITNREYLFRRLQEKPRTYEVLRLKNEFQNRPEMACTAGI